MTFAVQALTFVAQLGASYLLGRIGAQDAPRLENLSAGSGEFGVPIPRAYGGAARYTLPILDLSDIKETEHEVQDYSEVVGAISGAAAGFLAAGPIGAVIGLALGGLFGSSTPDQKYYTYSFPAVALLVADRLDDEPIEDLLKMWANGRVLFDPAELPAPVTTLDSDGNLLKRVWGKNRYFEELTLYGGGAEQVADPTLVAEIGPQPGYRHRAYVVIKELQLEFFGNALPTPIEGLVRAREGQSLAEYVDAVSASANIDAARDLSSSEMVKTVLAGLAITEQKSCWDAIRPILPAYRMDVAEVAGQLRFHKRAQGWRGTLTEDDLGAYQFGNSPPARVEFTRSDPSQSPRATNLTFIDPGRDYQSNTAISQRNGGDSRSNIDITLALTLDADEAAAAASTMHWDATLGIVRCNFSVTDDWIGLEPGRVYALPVDGQVLPYRVTQRIRGANGVSEIEARSEEDIVFRGTVRGSNGNPVVNESTQFAETVVVPIDMPMTADAHDDFGFYLAMGAGAQYWTRGRIEVSGDGVNFATAIDSDQVAVMGNVVGTLAAGSTTGLDDALDTTSVLEVELLHDGMTLSDAADAELDANANFAFVGTGGKGEFLQWKTATKTAPRTWELTNLRRGRRGTDYALGEHVAGEQFVVLGEGGIYRIVANDDTGWGDTLTLRGVHLLENSGGQAEVTFANAGQSKRPYSPVSLAGSFDGAGDLSLTWVRRSRFDTGEIGTDAPEAYEVDIYDGAIFKRTLSSSTSAVTYLAADQTTDGFSGGDIITARSYQLNTDFGRSKPREATFEVPSGGGAVSSQTMAVQSFSYPSGTGTFDVTTTDLGGGTPTAALVVISGNTSGTSASPDAILSWGAVGTTNQAGGGFFCEDNIASSVTERSGVNTAILSVFASSGAVNTLSFDSFITNGIRMSRDATNNAATTGYRGFVILFADGATVDVGTLALGTGTSALTVGSLSAAPEAVILLSNGTTFSAGVDTVAAAASIGIATSSKQRGWRLGVQGASFNTTRARLYDNATAGQYSAYGLVVDNFTSNSFDVTPSHNAGSDEVLYLSVNFGGADFELIDIDTPTATGNDATTGAGFQPNACFALASASTTINSSNLSLSDTVGESFGLSGFTENVEAGCSIFVEDAVATSNCESYAPDAALVTGTTVNATQVEAGFVSFDSDGFTLNYSSASASLRRGFALVVG